MNLIAIDLGGTKIKTGLIKSNKCIKSEIHLLNNKNSKSKIILQIELAIKHLFNKNIKKINIAVPGISKDGIIIETPNLKKLNGVNLKKIIEKEFNCKVTIENDAKCFALGCREIYKTKNFAAITLGTGFGCGIIINGKLFHGIDNSAGEYSRIKFKDKNIDYYCSGQFLIDGFKEYALAENGNKNSLNKFEEFGKNLAFGISCIISSIDVNLIIIGGSVSKANKYFHKPMMIELKKLIYKHQFKKLRIKYDKNKNTSMIGISKI